MTTAFGVRGSKADGELHKDERVFRNSSLSVFREKVVGDAIQKEKWGDSDVMQMKIDGGGGK